MSRAQVIRTVKVRCPRCGAEIPLELTPNIIEEAKANPLGLAGVAYPHLDHVLIVYFDRNGEERGVRVFLTLQAPEKGLYEILLSKDDLKGLRNISGFRVESRKLNIRISSFTTATTAALKISGRDTIVEVDFQRDFSYQILRGWLEILLDVLENSYSSAPLDYVNTFRILDIMLEEKPFAYAKQVFWLVANGSTITIRPRLPEALLLKKYRPTLVYEKYSGAFISKVIEKNEMKVSEALGEDNPQVLFVNAEALLSLYRRGVLDLVIE
jgi:hypothetical protein